MGDLARHEHHAAELDGDIALAITGLAALAGVGAQRLDADVEGAQRRRVPHRAVDDQPHPAVLDTEPGDDVADEGGVLHCSQDDEVVMISGGGGGGGAGLAAWVGSPDDGDDENEEK